MREFLSFSKEITKNKTSEAPTTAASLHTKQSMLSVRERGCFITSCELTSPSTGEQIAVLYSDSDTTIAKLTASHIMSPVGPTDSIGGQHGFGRWADYHRFELPDSLGKEKRIAFQAKRSDMGLSLVKMYNLTETSLTTETTIYNSEQLTQATSLGEHLYFSLANEQSGGLMVNGQSLNKLLRQGAEQTIMGGRALYWPEFEGETNITFPAGYQIQLCASSNTEANLGMLIWHRVGSQSICFEPTIGFTADGKNNGTFLPAYAGATLKTAIKLL